MDNLDNLPLDASKQASPSELKVLQKYFGNKTQNTKLWNELKGVVIATALFIILSTNFFDKCLDYLPNTDSPMIKLGLKVLIYAPTLYVVIIMTN